MTNAPDSDVEKAVLDPRFDPMRVAVYSDTSPVQAQPLAALPAPLGITTTTSNFGPGHATITLSAPAPKGSSLVVAENYYPGWHAIVDGKPQPVYRADYNLIGVPLPEGARSVELTFHDRAVDTGKKITLVALVIALAVLVGGVVADRRQGLV
jgi:hypothetical protein